MRLIIIGSLNGQIGAASKIAMARGAKVSIVEDIESALQALRAGQGADVIMYALFLPHGWAIASARRDA